MKLHPDAKTTPFTRELRVERVPGLGPLDAVMLHPRMGGLDPDFSWECLRLIEAKVLPAAR